MRLKQLTIQGFRSFAQKTVIDFDGPDGLYLIQGENGAGKSSIWAAVCWILYGKTDRGVSGPQVEGWYSDLPCGGELELTVGGIEHTISRTRKPQTFTIDGKEAVQEHLVELVGLSYERFLQVVLLGQFGVLFADMRPTGRLNLITDVLELDFWADASKRAQEWIQQYEQQIIAAKTKIEIWDQALQRLMGSVADLERKGEAWRKEKARAIQRGRADVQKARRRLDSEREQLRVAEEQLEPINDKLNRLEDKRASIESDIEGAQEAVTSHEKRCAVLTHQLESIRDTSDRIGQMDVSSECPHCFQEVTQEYADSLNSDLEADYEERRIEFERERKLLAAARAGVGDLQDRLRALLDLYRKTESDESTIQERVRALKSNLQFWESTVSHNLQEVEKLRSQNQPFSDLLDKELGEVRELEDLLFQHEGDLHTMVSAADLLRDWPRLFKELRLWIVEDALVELEAYANSALEDLGLEDWSVYFQVERETQRGSVVRGFEILVQSPESPERVPWEAWSGGETQRVRVACAVGLATLIRSRMPHAPEVEVWDEPTAHLNQAGVDDLVSFMAERGRHLQVWLIDHRTMDQGSVTRSVRVEKTASGSRIIG